MAATHKSLYDTSYWVPLPPDYRWVHFQKKWVWARYKGVTPFACSMRFNAVDANASIRWGNSRKNFFKRDPFVRKWFFFTDLKEGQQMGYDFGRLEIDTCFIYFCDPLDGDEKVEKCMQSIRKKVFEWRLGLPFRLRRVIHTRRLGRNRIIVWRTE